MAYQKGSKKAGLPGIEGELVKCLAMRVSAPG